MYSFHFQIILVLLMRNYHNNKKIFWLKLEKEDTKRTRKGKELNLWVNNIKLN